VMFGEVVIVPYRDGPYLVRGAFALRDQAGAAIGRRRGTVALCRCGKSRTRPFCDGTHRAIGFAAPSHAEVERSGNGDDGCEPTGLVESVHRPRPRVLSALRGARADLQLVAETPSSAHAYLSLRAAESLLAAVHELVDGRELSSAASEPEDSWVEPCRCLIKGALDAIARAGETGADVAGLAARVAALSRLLRTEAGVA
jgi:CDGSH-type Zn-finger protein